MKLTSWQWGALCLTLTLTGCGSGGGSSSGGGVPAPVAKVDISPDRLPVGDIAVLDGRASDSPNGALTRFSWQVSKAPAESRALPQPADDALSEFVPDRPGEYQLCLEVEDDKRTSTPACSTLVATNIDPVAVISSHAVAVLGQFVQLDGTGSLPPEDGDPQLLVYQWDIVGKPDGSQAALDDAQNSMPRFRADLEGVYQVQLTVFHQQRVSHSVTQDITVSAINTPPVAVAGPKIVDQVLGQQVTLDGSGSHDPDGDPLQYRWGFGYQQTIPGGGRPTGSTAELVDWDTATPSFVPDVVGEYVIWLQVFDGQALSGLSFVNVVVNQLAPDHVNQPPVAVITPPWSKTFELELGEQLTVTTAYSFDPETGPIQAGHVELTLIKHPPAFDPVNDVTQHPNWNTYNLRVAGEYRFRLRVSDGELWSVPVEQSYVVRTGANRAPQAVAKVSGPSATVGVGDLITLDAEGSYDPDGNRMTYQWRMLQKPDGSTAELAGVTTALPTFTADQAGPYMVALNVTDSHGESSSREAVVIVFAKTENHAPVARPQYANQHFNARQPFVIYPKAELEISGSWPTISSHNASVRLRSDAYDPDSDQLSYLWSMTDEPAANSLVLAVGSNYDAGVCSMGYTVNPQGPYTTGQQLYDALMAVRDWTCADLNLSPALPGRYGVQLMVTDGIDITGPFNFTFHAVERAQYPSLLLEDMAGTFASPNGDNRVLGEGSTAMRHLTFPVAHKSPGSFPLFDNRISAGDDIVMKTYQLTAFDRDYTITDLAAISGDPASRSHWVAEFEGLEDGQVIKRGTTVTFTLMLRIPADYQRLDIAEEGQRDGALGMAYRFNVAEEPGWSFSYSPYIYLTHDSGR